MARIKSSEDHRTVDAAGNVVIITTSIDSFVGEAYSCNEGFTKYRRINLSHHEYEPGFFESKVKRYATKEPSIPYFKCTCGQTLVPIENGLRHQSIVECQCESCRAKQFVEIPYKKKSEMYIG